MSHPTPLNLERNTALIAKLDVIGIRLSRLTAGDAEAADVIQALRDMLAFDPDNRELWTWARDVFSAALEPSDVE